MQSGNKKRTETEEKVRGFDRNLISIFLPIFLIAPFIMTGLITLVSGKLSTFSQMFFPIAGTVYGGTLIYILFLWITKPVRDTAGSFKKRLLELFAGTIAKLVILFVLGFIILFTYMVIKGQ